MARRAEPSLAMRLATRLKQGRAARGWTQERAAEQARVGLRHYQKLEGAEVNANLRTLERLSRGFQVDVVELLRA